MASVDVELEVNLTVQSAKGPASAYLLDRWTLVRRANVRSRSAEKARILDCPNCGAPLSAVIAGHCSHCKKAVSTGDFGWVVQNAQVLRYEPRPPLLTTEVEEEGTDLATVVDPFAASALQALWEKDHTFQWPQFEQRVWLIFREFQVAWSNRDLAKMRPYLSDNLFQMQTSSRSSGTSARTPASSASSWPGSTRTSRSMPSPRGSLPPASTTP
jgi:hypothetical protein